MTLSKKLIWTFEQGFGKRSLKQKLVNRGWSWYNLFLPVDYQMFICSFCWKVWYGFTVLTWKWKHRNSSIYLTRGIWKTSLFLQTERMDQLTSLFLTVLFFFLTYFWLISCFMNPLSHRLGTFSGLLYSTLVTSEAFFLKNISMTSRFLP